MTLSVNNVELFCEVVGYGAPLIMMHGNGEDHTIFDEAVQVLKEHYTCYLLDSRGHGKSSRVDELNYTDMADDVLALIDRAGLQKVNFYGFSDGGIVGLLAASKRPQAFEHLIVSGANLYPRGLKDGVYQAARLKYLIKKDPKLKMMLTQPDISGDQLRRITAHTLVLAGQHDMIKELHTRAIARCIPGALLRILPDETHGSYIVHSSKIAHIILHFCRFNTE